MRYSQLAEQGRKKRPDKCLYAVLSPHGHIPFRPCAGGKVSPCDPINVYNVNGDRRLPMGCAGTDDTGRCSACKCGFRDYRAT